MRARQCLLATASVAVLALLSACQDGSTSTSAAGSTGATSPAGGAAVSTSTSSPSTSQPSPSVPTPAMTPDPTVADVAAQSAAQSALQQAQSAASSAAGARVGSPAARSTAARSTAAPARPVEARVQQGGRYWGVYLASSPTSGTQRVQSAYGHLREQGYTGSIGQAGCDSGALDSIGIGQGDEVASVYFATRDEAQRFVARWNRPYVGYVQVRTYCAD